MLLCVYLCVGICACVYMCAHSVCNLFTLCFQREVYVLDDLGVVCVEEGEGGQLHVSVAHNR